jgi:hypothetical protein
VNDFPIRPIRFSYPADVVRHDRMVALIQFMLATTHTPNEKTMLQRQITATDNQIDRYVVTGFLPGKL